MCTLGAAPLVFLMGGFRNEYFFFSLNTQANKFFWYKYKTSQIYPQTVFLSSFIKIMFLLAELLPFEIGFETSIYTFYTFYMCTKIPKQFSSAN